MIETGAMISESRNEVSNSPTDPLVTIVALSFNQSRFIIECLDSIRGQTYSNIQLIITDDASQDDSVAVIQKWIADSGIDCVFLTHNENRGVCKALNEAVSLAQGKYLTMIAADDIYLPQRIEQQVRMMEKLPDDVGVVYSDASTMDVDGNALPYTFIEWRGDFFPAPEGRIFPVLLQKCFIPAMAALIRTSCFQKVGTYDEQLVAEDWDMWLRISRHYRFAFSPVISARYRIHPTSMSRTVMSTLNCRKLHTNFRIYEKCWIPEELTPDGRKLITDGLAEVAEQMYEIDCNNRTKSLWKLMRFDPRPRTIALWIFSTLRIPYPYFLRFVEIFGSAVRGFKTSRS
jgi:alpha-1,3-rhamnosyltransferase